MKSTIIKNVTVVTMNRQNDRFFGFVKLENGKITAVGEGENAPAADTVMDAAGGYLLPGLIDAHAHIGLYEDSLGFEGEDGNEDTDPITPQLRALDGVNPFDRAFREALEAGVTSVAISPGSANPIGGQIVAVKTAGIRVDDMVLREPLAIKFAFGENPKSCYHEKDETPVTRMATAALIREELYKAKEYLARKERAAQDPDEEEPEYEMKLEALVPLLRGEITAHIHAHRADDIFTALRIAKEFGIRPVIVHGTEGHLIAPMLAAERIPVLSGPHMTDRSKPELSNMRADAAGDLTSKGVKTAISVDHPEIPLRLLLEAARLSAKAGMDEWDALRAITAVPAEIMELDDRIGSLEIGKDADCVLFNGHPFDWRTKVQAVWIDGEMLVGRNV